MPETLLAEDTQRCGDESPHPLFTRLARNDFSQAGRLGNWARLFPFRTRTPLSCRLTPFRPARAQGSLRHGRQLRVHRLSEIKNVPANHPAHETCRANIP